MNLTQSDRSLLNLACSRHLQDEFSCLQRATLKIESEFLTVLAPERDIDDIIRASFEIVSLLQLVSGYTVMSLYDSDGTWIFDFALCAAPDWEIE